jgi:hypothetical protein
LNEQYFVQNSFKVGKVKRNKKISVTKVKDVTKSVWHGVSKGVEDG